VASSFQTATSQPTRRGSSDASVSYRVGSFIVRWSVTGAFLALYNL